ncbi:MAG: c-type cytochrome [Gemmatimonadota bacterium]
MSPAPVTAAATVAALLLAASPASAQQSEADARRSVLDGVFTEEQATRGGELFADRCAECHSTYEFSSTGYLLSWVGTTLDQLYDLIATTMPYDRPGALPAEEYAAVLAYLLELNAYPAGGSALADDRDALRGIRIERAPEDDGG